MTFKEMIVEAEYLIASKKKRLLTADPKWLAMNQKEIAIIEAMLGQMRLWRKAYSDLGGANDSQFVEFLFQHNAMYEKQMGHYERRLGLRSKKVRAIRNAHKNYLDLHSKQEILWATEKAK